MKARTKTLLTSVATIALCASAIAGGTYALFTDEAKANVAITSGVVDVEATIVEESLVTYSRGVLQESGSFANDAPGVNGATFEDGVLKLANITPGDKAEFEIAVSNNSTVSILYRAVAYITGDDLKDYLVWTSDADEWTYQKGNTTIENVKVSVELPEDVQRQGLGSANVAFTVEAVQGNGDVSGRVRASSAAEIQNILENTTKDVEIRLTQDITTDTPLEIKNGRNVVLNLNGKTLNIPADVTSNVIQNHGNLTLKNGTIDGNTTGNREGYAVYSDNGTLTVENVTITESTGMFHLTNTTAVINGGEFGPTANAESRHVVRAGENTNVTINGGHFVHGTNAGSAIYAVDNAVVTINDGTFTSQSTSYMIDTNNTATLVINGGTFTAECARLSGNSVVTITGGVFNTRIDYLGTNTTTVSGGTFTTNPAINAHVRVAAGYKSVQATDGTWKIERDYQTVSVSAENTAESNKTVLAEAIAATDENTFLQLSAGEYRMPNVSGAKEFTIVGTTDTIIDVTKGAYMDQSKVAFEGVTIKGSTGYAENGGGDYAALYTSNVTYTNCTFDGPFRIGRDGATFINCTFKNLGNDYVWTYGNSATFIGCTFETAGKALLIYADGGANVSEVTVKNCVFKATNGAKAGAIANQNCAAIEIDNYGCGVKLTLEGNTYSDAFSGEWRMKSCYDNGNAVIVDGVTYTSIALDGKLMTIDADRNVTVLG